ncbi:MAG: alpha/beta hydrolase fold domain-containing protein [Acidimicrobiales bacterium]
MVVQVQTDLVYATIAGYRPLALDLYVDAEPQALCIWLHGGGWQRGSRRNGPGPPALDSRPLFHRMAQRGLAVVSVDYRLSREATHPAQLDDVVAAYRFVRGEGAPLGGSYLPLALWGTSAGAHLAGLAALASEVGDEIAAVASWSAPSDFTALAGDLEAIGEIPDVGPTSREAMLVGASATEAPDLHRAASPVAHVRPTATAFSLVHGADDRAVPPAQSERYAAALAAAGVAVRTHFVEGADHFYSTISAERLCELVDETIDFIVEACR